MKICDVIKFIACQTETRNLISLMNAARDNANNVRRFARYSRLRNRSVYYWPVVEEIFACVRKYQKLFPWNPREIKTSSDMICNRCGYVNVKCNVKCNRIFVESYVTIYPDACGVHEGLRRTKEHNIFYYKDNFYEIWFEYLFLLLLSFYSVRFRL